MNKHPKSEDILKVIQVFEKVLPMAKKEDNLDMQEINIKRGDCGTICCHGGWYVVAKKKRGSFYEGIEMLSKDLRLGNMVDTSVDNAVTYWAESNENLWGNKDGRCMFSEPTAFYHPTRRPEGAKTLQHIVDHWKEVYERVKAMEQPEKPKERIVYVTVSEGLKKQIPELINN